MRVRFLDDGSTADLNIEIQRRIWENILAEEEAKQAARAARASMRARAYSQSTQFFIKPISILAAEELTFPGWQERVAATGDETQEIKPGDRLIYYAIEPQVFFAVATVTGVSFEAGSAGEGEQVRFYPIDLDAHAHNLEKAVALDSVELESQPNLKELLKQPDTYFKISEDDFELLAELLTEMTEEEEEDEEEEEEEEEDEE